MQTCSAQTHLNLQQRKKIICEKLIGKSCLDFTGILASKAPVPNGGGAAALVGTLRTALCFMVGDLTVGHKKYAEAEYDIKIMLKKAEAIQVRLLGLVEENTAVFKSLAKVYSILKENSKRAEFLKEVTLNACKTPLKMIECCCEAIDLLEEMVGKGSATLISDIDCSALCCKTVLESAGVNVFVNTRTLADKNQMAEIEAKADAMLTVYNGIASRIVEEVTHRLWGVK